MSQALQQGTYVIALKTNWVSFVNEFSFSIYGPSKTVISQISPNSLGKSFFNVIFAQHALHDKSTKYNVFEGPNVKNIRYKLYDSKGGVGYIFFSNEDPSITASITLDLTGSSNIELMSPFCGLSPEIALDPKSTKIICY